MKGKKILKYICGGTIGAFALATLTTIWSYCPKPDLDFHNNLKSKQLSADINLMSCNVAGGWAKNFSWPKDSFSHYQISDQGFKVLEKLIIENNIDLACFQEIVKSKARGKAGNTENQIEEISKNSGLENYVFDSNVTTDFINHLENGNAIMSKVHIFGRWRENLEPYRTFGMSTISEYITGTKGILHSRIHYRSNPINILCTHLSNLELTLEGEEREQEINALFKSAAKRTPAIVMGDLNTNSYDKAWKIVEEIAKKENLTIDCGLEKLGLNGITKTRNSTFLGEVNYKDLGKTNTRPNTDEIIDYICIVSNPDDSLRIEYKSLEHNHMYNISDHVPLFAKFKISEK